MKKSVIFSAAVFLISCVAPAYAQDCPPGTYRMMRGYGEGSTCAPYGQGGPNKPAPPRRQSDITGLGGDRSSGGSTGSGLSAPAK
jgi:hypothetical protein